MQHRFQGHVAAAELSITADVELSMFGTGSPVSAVTFNGGPASGVKVALGPTSGL